MSAGKKLGRGIDTLRARAFSYMDGSRPNPAWGLHVGCALLIRLALLVCIVTMGRSIIFGIRRKPKRSADDERLKAAMSFLSALRIPLSLFILYCGAQGLFYLIITCS